jgi:hypothetical protein
MYRRLLSRHQLAFRPAASGTTRPGYTSARIRALQPRSPSPRNHGIPGLRWSAGPGLRLDQHAAPQKRKPRTVGEPAAVQRRPTAYSLQPPVCFSAPWRRRKHHAPIRAEGLQRGVAATRKRRSRVARSPVRCAKGGRTQARMPVPPDSLSGLYSVCFQRPDAEKELQGLTRMS